MQSMEAAQLPDELRDWVSSWYSEVHYCEIATSDVRTRAQEHELGATGAVLGGSGIDLKLVGSRLPSTLHLLCGCAVAGWTCWLLRWCCPCPLHLSRGHLS